MAFLVHIKSRSGVTALVIDKLVVISASFTDCIRVVHSIITTDPHAAVGAYMRFETTIRNKNAAQHACSRIVLRRQRERTSPHTICVLRRGVWILTCCCARTLATTNDHTAGIGKVPHNLLSTLGVITVSVRTAQFLRGVIRVGPPEPPTVVEIHFLTGHVNDHGRSVRNLLERETNTGIRRRIIEHVCRQIEHLHGGCAIAHEFDDLLVHTADIEAICVIEFGAYQTVVALVAGSCLSVSHIDALRLLLIEVAQVARQGLDIRAETIERLACGTNLIVILLPVDGALCTFRNIHGCTILILVLVRITRTFAENII